MSKSFERYQKRRLISSYFSVILSISLVLFLLGMLGLMVINTKKLADHFKEQVAVSIFLKDDAKKVEIDQLQKSLALAEYTRSVEFVSKEAAAEAQSAEIGEDFMKFLGYNPLQNSIDVRLKADYVDAVKLEQIAGEITAKDFVDEVSYDRPLITMLNDNIKRLSFWILLASAAFTLIAVLLINSSIRLSIYSKRFIIKTMQMVGATKRFIRRPFIWTSVKLGITGAIIAVIAMGMCLYYINERFPELHLTDDPLWLIVLFAGIFLMGVVISWISTYFAAQRFLNLRTDDLYY
ncbi:FtsX-like permease family protein [Sinomicrobium pectinilyticum]|uniref:Cell division protein FtsX n=1 Tax=Sinomicrobium pectinilyticum TaxID=1084421 RepID=A0A3N0EZA4_SINP1|nr:permease-like cell division protein FtsX [Sinomicrobium pectinilyticum]RNL93057.1 FtsX-like permease family protein [Sinomicrobium pectinilyticum]